jgi:arsenate reductase (glutaredoxin)
MSFTPNKFTIIFYEKPGCAGNHKQKTVLKNQGLSFQTKSILDTPWTSDSLSLFFKNLEKKDIINPFAPKIKNKELDIDTISKEELIELMCQEPILIKRPLLEIGEQKLCGFDINAINEIFDIEICGNIKISTCQSIDLCKSAS